MTPVDMLSPGAGKTKTTRLWAYVPDERPWAGPSPPAVFYPFSRDRKGEQPTGYLQSYSGWMHADGYTGFNELYRSGRVREVDCMAHIQRKFVDVFKSQESGITEEAIKHIASLCAVEQVDTHAAMGGSFLMDDRSPAPKFSHTSHLT